MTNEATAPAVTFSPDIKMHHATRTKATKLMVTLEAEYPKLRLTCATDNDHEGNEIATGFEVEFADEDELIYEGDKVPSLAEILDTCAERELDPSADEDEEPKASGSVVPEHYRTQYRAASSNGQTCGDWLAEWLVGQTNNGTFNVEDFQAIIEHNGLDQTKAWAKLPTSGQLGWVGRYRMNGRQALEKVAAQRGYVLDTMANMVLIPEDFLATIRTKHGKWLAKQAKIEMDLLATAGKTDGEADAA